MATYDQQTRQVERRRQLAQMLMQQANAQPQQQGGRFYVGPTPFSALGRLASGVGGAYMEHKADQDQVAAEDAERKRLTEALGQMRGGGAQPQQQGPAPGQSEQQGAAAQLLQGLPLDQYRQFVGGQALQTLFPKLERIDLGNEYGLVDAHGNVVQRIAKGASPDAVMKERGEQYRFDNPSGNAQLGAETARRGQDLSANVSMRGQDITMRGQDLSAETTRRGQDMSAETTRRGQDMTSGRGKPLTEFQAKSVNQLTRMEGAENLIKNVAPGLMEAAGSRIPGVGNYTTSADYQAYQQAAREWISGVLRLDSGAAVPELEFNRYFATYFPQPGDSDEVITQKAASRQRATEALRSSLSDVADRLPQRPGDPASGDTGFDDIMSRYLGGGGR